MYNRDCKAIAEHASKSPQGLVDVIEFTLCTIQAGLSTVKAQRLDIQKTGLDSKYLWGKKSDGLNYAIWNSHYLFSKLTHLQQQSLNDPDVITEGIMLLMKVPNLGMVKASFVMQMLGFNVACIDSHNIKRLGLKPSAVQTPPAKMKEASKRKKVTTYVEMCQIEGTEYWWDTWCEHVAGNRANKALDTGDVVSRYHVECVAAVEV